MLQEKELTKGICASAKLGTVHRALVAWQLIQQFARVAAPNDNRSISSSDADLLTLLVPASPDQVLLDSARRTVECPDVSLSRRKRPDIPRPRGRIHSVRQKLLRVRRDAQTRYRIVMSQHLVNDLLFPDIPHLDVVVDTTRVNLVSSLRDSHRRDREIRLDIVGRVLRPRIPDPYCAVVAAAYEKLLAAFADVHRVDDLLVPDVAPDALS